MKPIMKSIYERLQNNQPISKRQLEVIIPYLKNDLKDLPPSVNDESI